MKRIFFILFLVLPACGSDSARSGAPVLTEIVQLNDSWNTVFGGYSPDGNDVYATQDWYWPALGQDCHPATLQAHDISGAASGQALQQADGLIFVLTSAHATVLALDEDLQEVWRGSLSVKGAYHIAHPTGLAYKEGYPTLIGGNKKFHEIDWELFLKDGTLDHALIRDIPDPYASGFVRAEYVTVGVKTYLASGDYSSRPQITGLPHGLNNQIRLYDADRLAESETVGGLLAQSFAVPEFIQSYAWTDQGLILARNVSYLQGWILDVVDVQDGTIEKSVCFDYDSELEGYEYLPDGREVFLTGEKGHNLFVTPSH